jgi:hypothetical protein
MLIGLIPLLQEPAGLMGQHLFSVYVHPGQRHPGYPPGTLFHGREVPNRVQVWAGLFSWFLQKPTRGQLGWSDAAAASVGGVCAGLLVAAA